MIAFELIFYLAMNINPWRLKLACLWVTATHPQSHPASVNWRARVIVRSIASIESAFLLGLKIKHSSFLTISFDLLIHGAKVQLVSQNIA